MNVGDLVILDYPDNYDKIKDSRYVKTFGGQPLKIKEVQPMDRAIYDIVKNRSCWNGDRNLYILDHPKLTYCKFTSILLHLVSSYDKLETIF